MTSSSRHKVAILLLVIIVLCGVICKAQSANGTDTGIVEETVRILERSCVSNLRALNVAQITYWGGDNTKGFARTLKQLGPEGEGLLNAATVSGEKSGYGFRLVPDSGVRESDPIKHYEIIAQPVKRITKRQRSYYTDETGVIRFTEEKREPTSADPPLGPPKDR